jgi:transcriptional regulator with XRE-family HTH domain
MINNINDGSGERLFSIRKALELTQIDFAKILNSSNGHVSDMEKDRKNITDSTIELLVLKCAVNEEYIRYGTEPMFIQTPSSTMEQLRQEFNLDDFSYDLIYQYLKLDASKRKTVRDFFYNVIVPQSEQKKQEAQKSHETKEPQEPTKSQEPKTD